MRRRHAKIGGTIDREDKGAKVGGGFISLAGPFIVGWDGSELTEWYKAGEWIESGVGVGGEWVDFNIGVAGEWVDSNVGITGEWIDFNVGIAGDNL